MTAVINGELFEMYNPNGTDEATRSVFTFYPNLDYIQLQGAKISDNNLLEVGIDIWIHRNNLQVGTYQVGVGTFGTATHVDLIDTRSAETENTISGSITITDIDIDDKIIKGTFEFNAADISDISAPVNATVTEGTFHYRYDVN